MDSPISTHEEMESALAPAARAAGPGRVSAPVAGNERRESRTPPTVKILAPAPGEAGAGSAVLVGVAVALKRNNEMRGAYDVRSRVELLACDKLPEMISTHVDDRDTFGGEVRAIHVYWLASAAVVLEHRAIAAARPRPANIGGFPLAQALEGAISLATISPPFDLLIGALKRLAQEVASDGQPTTH